MCRFRQLEYALLAAACFISMSCGQKPSGKELVQTPPPPLDSGRSDAQPQVERFASQHGALGQYYDASSGSFVIVFPADAAPPPPDRIARQLHVPVRIQQVELTQDLYDSIQTEVAHLHSLHPGSTYSIYLDLAMGKARLTSDLPLEVLQPLLRKHRHLIESQASSIHTDVTQSQPH